MTIPIKLRIRVCRILKSLSRLSFRRIKPQAQNTPPEDTRRPPPLPELPLELWIMIIKEAAAVHPDPLDASNGVSFLESSDCKLRDYRSGMRIKTNFSLVNHRWNVISHEFLFEFVWISRASQAKALAHSLLEQEYIKGVRPSGRYIRRLHIETSTLERCSPADLRTILDYAPGLVMFSDYYSIRRNRYEEFYDPRLSPEQFLSTLVHPKNALRRLSWTFYDDLSFHSHMVPCLTATAFNLEYLELYFCAPSLTPFHPSDPMSSRTLVQSCCAITLPTLRSLKVTLDNSTFAVLASWDMPNMTNLSVVSSDFSYAGEGFSKFFHVHGARLTQLELGHSSSVIEEHYLAVPTHDQSIPLATWCPNLRQFICSADAEWNWQTPDWIAPHILLPTHPTLEFIGIRDIDKRLRDDASLTSSLLDDTPFFPLLEQLASLMNSQAFPSLRYIRDLSDESDIMRRCHPEVRIVKFWLSVLNRCRSSSVYLEDYQGINVTLRDLKRASLNMTS